MRHLLALLLIFIILFITGLSVPMAISDATSHMDEQAVHVGVVDQLAKEDMTARHQDTRLEQRMREFVGDWSRLQHLLPVFYKKTMLDDTWDRRQFQSRDNAKYKEAVAVFINIRTQLFWEQLSTPQRYVMDRDEVDGSSNQTIFV